MIRCIPTGLCSWNYNLQGNGHHANVEINWLGEQGVITIEGKSCDVRKHGAFSGQWTLELNELVTSNLNRIPDKVLLSTRPTATNPFEDRVILRAVEVVECCHEMFVTCADE